MGANLRKRKAPSRPSPRGKATLSQTLIEEISFNFFALLKRKNFSKKQNLLAELYSIADVLFILFGTVM